MIIIVTVTLARLYYSPAQISDVEIQREQDTRSKRGRKRETVVTFQSTSSAEITFVLFDTVINLARNTYPTQLDGSFASSPVDG